MKKVEIEGILPQVMILDLNGTLVNSMGGAISPRIAELLEDISEHASMYVVSSYNSEMIKHILEDAGISPEIFSGFNGAVRLDTSDMELVDYLTSDFDLFARCTSKIQGILNALAQEGIGKKEIMNRDSKLGEVVSIGDGESEENCAELLGIRHFKVNSWSVEGVLSKKLDILRKYEKPRWNKPPVKVNGKVRLKVFN